MSNGPAWLAAAAGAAGAGAAWFAAVNGVRTLLQTRRDSLNRSRPMVAAEFRDASPSRGTLYLVIRNYGPSVAKNVQVSFDPAIPDPPPEMAKESVVPFLKRRYSRVIPTLTPGTELRNVYYIGEPQGGFFINSEPTPERVLVTISCESADGKQRYTDTFDLDVDLIQNETWVTSSLAMESQVKDIRAHLKGIDKSMQSISRNLQTGRRSADNENS
jgi:hypothetical protein